MSISTLTRVTAPFNGGMSQIVSGRFGDRIRFAAEDGSGSGTAGAENGDDAANSRAEENRQGGEKGDEGEKKVSALSEKEAILLKDVMKHKESAKNAKAKAEQVSAEINELRSRLKEVVGSDDLDGLSERLKVLKEAEEQRMKANGEFEALRERMSAEHKKELERIVGTRNQEVGELTKKLSEKDNTIRKLAVSNSFSSSKLIADELSLTPRHAERLFGDAFKVEVHDGEPIIVAYRGSEPLTDASGKPKSFDEALRELVTSDPDHESLFKPKARRGSGSGLEGQSSEAGEAKKQEAAIRGVDRIAASLSTKP